ncbi:hypothetical protein [Pseudobacteroides cellulosolvens]|uniref:Uncharacterized protein n=1 Tax=Pseudobacteroides cellulosolvens ATCC 35603 = DSM 2933 TaxID=398512 RepID=A0A0L6JQS4_9FIRM|nr:hypothetical protein [Pseudobacteroides cellulosolvens]KNY28143.1 hypothetical protein Bccel_3414 [Pseudobacteroides cellulosolvens ATCC 35603 = DSM 2933]
MKNKKNKVIRFKKRSHFRYLISKRLIITIISSILILLAVYFCMSFPFYLPEYGIERTSITVEKNNHPLAPYDLLWFDNKDEVIKLNANMLTDISQLKFYSLGYEGKVFPLTHQGSPIAMNKGMTGTYAAILPTFKADIDNNGKKDKISLSAKFDSIFTQSSEFMFMKLFGVVRTNFTMKEIPLEIFYIEGSKVMIFYDQKPLANSKIQLISNRGLNKTVKTDAAGMLPSMNKKDLRKGIQVVYVSEDGTYNISSYTLEGEKFFTGYYYKAMLPFLKVMFYSAILILVILIVRKMYAYINNKMRDYKNSPESI